MPARLHDPGTLSATFQKGSSHMATSHTSCPVVARPVAGASPMTFPPVTTPAARSLAPSRRGPQHTRTRTT